MAEQQKTTKAGKRTRKGCAVCGKTIPRRLGLWAIYCSQRCADADADEAP